MEIKDFANMQQFENIMDNWAKSTGLATVAVDSKGNYISDCYNFTDFCITYTRGSKIGCERCEKCDRECHGVYECHAGLIDFSIDLIVNDEKLGSVIGGQVLPENPNEDKFRQVAKEIGVDEDLYINALHKVNVRSKESIIASANLLGQVLNNYINAEYNKKQNNEIISKLTDNFSKIDTLVDSVITCTKDLNSIQKKQKILALNASIEAARAGDMGSGFAVVAQEVGTLSLKSSEVNSKIEKYISDIAENLKDIK